MKRSWLARHPVGFMALYSIFYLSVFHYLEANVPLRSILVHCRLDDLIPFCKYAVIPYFAWFLWIPFTLFYLLWKAPREDFWRLCLPLFSGMTIALACYAVLPTALDLRLYRPRAQPAAAGAESLRKKEKATPVSAFGAGRGRFFISFFRTVPRAGRYPAWGLLSTQSPAQGFPGCGALAPAAIRRQTPVCR